MIIQYQDIAPPQTSNKEGEQALVDAGASIGVVVEYKTEMLPATGADLSESMNGLVAALPFAFGATVIVVGLSLLIRANGRRR